MDINNIDEVLAFLAVDVSEIEAGRIPAVATGPDASERARDLAIRPQWYAKRRTGHQQTKTSQNVYRTLVERGAHDLTPTE